MSNMELQHVLLESEEQLTNLILKSRLNSMSLFQSWGLG